ncbi:hypothetical protein BGV67_02900 [Burkholderia ubonensis]|uniref:hypothetical protein n=1 Tax=Burkholderia ubonensis TaxID=101571 RepID=UPI0008FE00AD|nr:hypothetical protein [Burkholderia ubonensis]OJA76074.1 hypothetical protein BGV67_02900 [Burkholderia ubonensis]OJB36518.1 hypothetical protein BGV57_26030 [Burkholderia ubonensis]
MIVVRTLTAVGGVRQTRSYTRKLDRAARRLGYRNARAWALAMIGQQLKFQSEAAQRARDVDYADVELRVAALEAA